METENVKARSVLMNSHCCEVIFRKFSANFPRLLELLSVRRSPVNVLSSRTSVYWPVSPQTNAKFAEISTDQSDMRALVHVSDVQMAVEGLCMIEFSECHWCKFGESGRHDDMGLRVIVFTCLHLVNLTQHFYTSHIDLAKPLVALRLCINRFRDTRLALGSQFIYDDGTPWCRTQIFIAVVIKAVYLCWKKSVSCIPSLGISLLCYLDFNCNHVWLLQ
jgi:hypothetical protein